jgi:Fe-Mn family superoxide dismutase
VDKRTFLKSLFLGAAGIFAIGLSSSLKAARSVKKWDGVFRMPELPYSFGSFKPFADAETMRLHYENHFASYTRDLNIAVVSAGLTGITAHQLLKESSRYPAEIRNLAGGYLNHKLFWRILTPAGGKSPSGDLTAAIDRNFGSFDNFKSSFLSKSASASGPAWVWLIAENNGNLKITSTANNDNPLMDLVPEKGFPLLCLDMWDHAGCSDIADYTSSFWSVVNWDVVSRRYAASSKQ